MLKIVEKIKKSIRWLPIIIIIVSLIVYNFFWDIIVTDRILSLNAYYGATVWDMGAFYGSLWVISHQFSFYIFLFYFSSKPIALVMSPLSQINNPFFFVYLQTFWISFTVVPLYIIGYRKTRYKSVSLIISISYLLFFGIAGQNWFDLHFQTLFVPLFVSGYALNLIGRRKLGFALIVISGLTDFPYLIFSILFFLFVFVEEAMNKRSFKISKLLYLGLIISIALLAMEYFVFSYMAGVNNANLQTYAHLATGGLINNITTNIDLKVYAILLLLFPFLCIPLLSKKWSVFILVYIVLLFVSGNANYFFPNFVRQQYLGMIVPFLYIGTIEVLSNLDHKISEYRTKGVKRRITLDTSLKFKLKIVITIFILIVLLGTVFEPYGPLNKYSSTDFQMNEITDYNISLYDHYIEMINMIPRNDPYILYQDNMPQIIYRDPTALTEYLGGEPYNYTYFIDGKWTSNITYIIADPYVQWFTLTGSGNYSSNMYITLDHFISSGQFGILAEYDGLIMLKKGYTGGPVIYGPENRAFTVQDLYSGITDQNGNLNISWSNLCSYQTLWKSPYTFMQPGNYVLKLKVKASNISSLNKFQLRFSYVLNSNSGAPTINVDLVNLTGQNLQYPNRWVNITLNIKATNFYDYVEFAGQDFHWRGSFSIGGISLNQVSP